MDNIFTALLKQYLDGKLSKDDYQAQKVRTAEEIQEGTNRLSELEERSGSHLELIENHKPFFNQDSLTAEIVKGLIQGNPSHDPEEMEIVWRFQDCYNEL